MSIARVFVLDNNEPLIEIFREHLSTKDISVDGATSYKEAMKNNLRVEYDCLFLDYSLDNGKTGVDFAREYSSVHDNPRIYIITGKRSEEIPFSSSYIDILQKPFDANFFDEALKLIVTPATSDLTKEVRVLIPLLRENIEVNKDGQEMLKKEFEKLSDGYINGLMKSAFSNFSGIIKQVGLISAGIIGLIGAIIGVVLKLVN